MDETKTFVFPDRGYGNSIDPNLLLNGGSMNGAWSNPLWALIFLAFLGRGWGGDFGGGTPNTGFVSSQLGQAIAGNANAISNLATSLNCTEGQIQTAIAGVQSSISQVANANNMSAMQVINAINSGNSNLANSLQSCCCDLKTTVNNQGYENRIANAEQTAIIGGKIDAQTTLINDKFCQLEMREMQNKIDALREEKSTLKGYIDNQQQTAQISAMIAPLQAEVASIKCKLPQTYNVPYQPFTAIPNCVAYGMGLYGNGYGLNPGGSIWS